MEQATSSRRFVFSDQPICSLAEDLYDRGPLVDTLVDAVVGLADRDSSGIAALVGARGCGKTSLLQLAVQDARLNHEFEIAWFNPWRVPIPERLTAELFAEIAAALPRGQRGRRARQALARYLRRLAPAVSMTARSVPAGDVIKEFASLVSPDMSLEATKRRAAAAIRACNRCLLVIVDDIDRLPPNDVADVFRMARLVADLPGVVYLMAFDLTTMSDTVSPTSPAGRERSSAYLDKVVDVVVSIPALHPGHRRRALSVAEEALLSEFGAKKDGRHWLPVATLSELLRQPRDIERTCSALMLSYPPLLGEVDFSDFALATLLRTKYPMLWDRLADWKEDLLGGRDYERFQHRVELIGHWEERLTESGVSAKDRAAVLSVLDLLFPRMDLRHWPFDRGNGDTPKSFACREYFDRYAYGTVGPDDVSDVAVELAVAEASAGNVVEALSLLGAVQNGSLLVRKLERIAAEWRAAECFALASSVWPAQFEWSSERDNAVAWGERVLNGVPRENEANVVSLILMANGLEFLGEVLLSLASADAAWKTRSVALEFARIVGRQMDEGASELSCSHAIYLTAVEGPARARRWVTTTFTTDNALWSFLATVSGRWLDIGNLSPLAEAKAKALERLLGSDLIQAIPTRVDDEQAEFVALGPDAWQQAHHGRRIAWRLRQRAEHHAANVDPGSLASG